MIARAHFHWLYGLAAWLRILVPVVALVALASMDNADPDFLKPTNLWTWGMGLAALALVIGFFGFLRMMIRRSTTEIGVTSHRFVEKYGVLSMRTNEIALPNIEGVKVNQTLLGRIFGYGTIRIEGTGVDAVNTPTIADPVGFVRAIQTAKEHVAARFEQSRSINP